MCALHMPYVHLTHTLHTLQVYDWLRVPATANHSLMCALHTPYMCLTHTLHVPYTCFMRTLHMPYTCFMIG